MKRNLKFWTRYTWESMAVDLSFMAGLAVITLFSAEGLDLGMFASIVPYYLCIAATFGRPGGTYCWASTTTGR